jgi:hypothetical protein
VHDRLRTGWGSLELLSALSRPDRHACTSPCGGTALRRRWTRYQVLHLSRGSAP